MELKRREENAQGLEEPGLVAQDADEAEQLGCGYRKAEDAEDVRDEAWRCDRDDCEYTGVSAARDREREGEGEGGRTRGSGEAQDAGDDRDDEELGEDGIDA